MENLTDEIHKISRELAEIKKKLEDYELARNFDNWIPRKILMQFLDYEDTQIAALFRTGELVVSEIGKRKFIQKQSIMKFLEKHIKNR